MLEEADNYKWVSGVLEWIETNTNRPLPLDCTALNSYNVQINPAQLDRLCGQTTTINFLLVLSRYQTAGENAEKGKRGLS